MRRLWVLVLTLLLALHPLGAVSGASAVPDSADGGTDSIHDASPLVQTQPTIVRTMSFSLTPSTPGEVDVRMSFSIPDSVEELETGVPEDATIRSTDGFRRGSALNYSWNGRTAEPSITFALPANETSAYHYFTPDGGPAAERSQSGLTFVDTGPWAIVSVPSAPASWTYRGLPAPTFERRVETAGDGVAGTRMVYLGPNSATTRMVDDQRITLVVPEAADLSVSTDAIFDSLADSSRSLPVGSKPVRSMFVAAPTTVSWGPYGVAEDQDAWVRADQELADPNNVWIHEYVHIRQDFRTTMDARWIFEAQAEYYAASLALQQGHIGFDTFGDHLSRGESDRFDGSILSEPSTWDPLANYIRGALVFGDLDRRMRLATDSRHPASHLLREMNAREEQVDHAFIRGQVATLSGTETARTFDRYVRTDRTPEMWSRSDHTAAFSTLPAIIATEVDPTVNVTGPYRNTSVETVPTLVPGERVTVSLDVSNVGDAAGEYGITLWLDGNDVSSANGTLAGGENTTVRLSHEVTDTGEFTLDIAGTTWDVTVAAPAEPVVTALQGPTDSVEPGEPVQVTIDVTNQADRPAFGSIPITADGSTVETWAPRLDVSQSTQRTVSVTFDDPGTHQISAGDKAVSIRVRAPSTSTQTTATQTPTQPLTPTETNTPGFGGTTALFAILLSLVLWVRFRAG